MKRLATPKHWMLDKLTGVWAPRPSTGPHKLRECLPLILILRNRLKYALTGREVKMILMNRSIKIDGKVRTDTGYPCGYMDVVSISETKEIFRLIYDVKGRFVLHKVKPSEEKFKLCRVVKRAIGNKGIPYIVTHDGRTIRYPDPDIKVSDTLKYNLEEGKITDHYVFQQNHVAMVTGGHNIGRVGHIQKIEKHPGSYDIIHLKDQRDHTFATRKSNVFILGDDRSAVSLPKKNGMEPGTKLTIIEERKIMLQRRAQANQ